MAAQALGPGETIVRRRAFFGLLDAGGWGWATLKAIFWFVVIIMMMAYLPDRALYAVVQPTIDFGVPLSVFNKNLDITPINLCPPSIQTLPCPAPIGAVLPWQPNPPELGLPQARTDAVMVSAGSQTLLVGGSDGKTAQDSVYATVIRSDGNIDAWSAGVPLPAPRAGAAAVFFAGSTYVIGGVDAAGAPTDTVFVATPDPDSGLVTAWAADDALKLPAPVADAAVVVGGDGLFLVGGRDAKGPVATVLKAPIVAATGKLKGWAPAASMPGPRAGATAVLQGTHLFVYGGEDAQGPIATVVRGEVGSVGSTLGQITGWSTPVTASANLPQAAKGAVGFVSNGTYYYVGGEGSGAIYWTAPDANGDLPGWTTLAQSGLPADLQLVDAAPIVSGSHAFLVGGTAAGTPTQGVTRSSLSPPQPFFRVGLFYIVVPALGIQGEVGQQLSYLAAAGVATVGLRAPLPHRVRLQPPGEVEGLLQADPRAAAPRRLTRRRRDVRLLPPTTAGKPGAPAVRPGRPRPVRGGRGARGGPPVPRRPSRRRRSGRRSSRCGGARR